MTVQITLQGSQIAVRMKNSLFHEFDCLWGRLEHA